MHYDYSKVHILSTWCPVTVHGLKQQNTSHDLSLFSRRFVFVRQLDINTIGKDRLSVSKTTRFCLNFEAQGNVFDFCREFNMPTYLQISSPHQTSKVDQTQTHQEGCIDRDAKQSRWYPWQLHTSCTPPWSTRCMSAHTDS